MKHSFRRFALSVGVMAYCSWASLTLSAAGVYSLTRDFSVTANPNGVWSYGYTPTLGGAFTKMAVPRTDEVPSVPIWSWSVTGYESPDVHYNASATNTFSADGGTFPPKTLWVAPGHETSPNAFAVMRFTAPTSAVYHLETSAKSYLDQYSGDTDFHVLKNGNQLFGANLPSGAQRTGFTNDVTLAAGDTLDLVTGRGQDGSLAGSALKLEAELSPLITSTNPPQTTNGCISVAAPSGIVGWWPFNGNNADVSGGNHPFPIVGPAVYSTGKVGQALALNGSRTNYGRLAANAAADLGANQAFTVEMWVNPTSVTYQQPLLEWNSGNSSVVGLHFWLAVPSGGGSGSLFANLISTSQVAHWVYSAGGILVPNQNQHIALTYSKVSGVAKLYANGAQVASSSVGVFTPETRLDVFAGLRPNAPESPFAGKLDEVTFYSRELSPSEIATIAQAGCGGKSAATNAPPPTTSFSNFNLARDFSTVGNPNGVWSYGYAPTLGGAFTRMAVPRTNEVPSVPIWSWSVTGYESPDVHYNASTTNTFYGDGGTFPPKTLWVAPGHETSPNAFAVMRFTAPSNGVYHVETAAKSYLDQYSGDSDFHVLKNGAGLFGINLPSGAQQTGYTNDVALAAGDTLDLAVGRGQDGLLWASALKLELELTPIAPWTNTPPTPAALSPDFNLTRDFATNSNPNGVWTYGWSPSLSSGFTPLGYTRVAWGDNGVPYELFELASGGTPPHFIHFPTNNTQTATSDGGHGQYPPGTLVYYAGNNGTAQNFVTARFTAPSNSNYQVAVAARAYLDGVSYGDTDFHVVKNGAEVFGQFLPAGGVTAYTNVLALAAGDTIDFALGRGADGSLNGSGLKIEAVLTPTTNAATVVTNTGSAPAIVSQPASRSVGVSGVATFTVSATGTGPLSYRWRYNGGTLSNGTTATLTLSNVQPSQAGSYSVLVSNLYGAVLSSNATLTVTSTVVVTNPPPVLAGDFNVQRDFTTNSNPNGVWTYGWQTAVGGAFNVVTQTHLSAAPNGVPYEVWELTLQGLPAFLHYPMSNTSTGAWGASTWPPGTLLVNPGFDGTPNNFAVVRFTAPSNGVYLLQMAVSPEYDGPEQGDTDFHVTRNGVELFGLFLAPADRAGYTNSFALNAGDTLDFAVGRGADGREYGSALKLWAVVTPSGSSGPVAVAPAIVSQPLGRSVVVGANVSFSVSASGSDPLSYQWRLNGTALDGAVLPTLSLANVQSNQAGAYSVVVSNLYGVVVSSNAMLTISSSLVPPRIMAVSSNRTVTAGAAVTFSVTAVGTAPLRYQWRFNGLNLTGATNASYTLVSAQTNHAGSYSVLVQNGAGAVTSGGIVLVVEQPSQAPYFVSQPLASATVDAGDSVTLSASVGGTPPMAYEWLFNGQPIAGANGSSLVLENVQLTNAGVYALRVNNDFGSALSGGTTLNVYQTNGGTVAFMNFSSNLVYDVNGTTPLAGGPRFLVELLGGPGATAMQPSVGPTRISSVPGRYNGGTRAIEGVSFGAMAWVQVRVWDSFVAATYDEAVLAGAKHGTSLVAQVQAGGSIQPPGILLPELVPAFHLYEGLPPVAPQIVTQPVSQSVPRGASVALSVSASGVGLAYQWLHNGEPKAGAVAATLVFSNTTMADCGEYALVVSNGGGAVTSAVAVLEVRIDRVLALSAPAEVTAGSVTPVVVTLESDGSVAGMTFELRYDPDFLSAPELVWDSGLAGAVTDSSLLAPGQLRGVLALPAGTIGAGTQTIATVNFRARSTVTNTSVALDLALVDMADAVGDALVYGNAAEGTSLVIDAFSGSLGDLNGNGRLDVGDATLILRLLSGSDSLRSWDLALADVNVNGGLDSGDAVKVLRSAVAVDVQPSVAKLATVASPKSGASLIERGAIMPVLIRATNGNTVTVQVWLQGIQTPISGAAFALVYPTNALRLLGPTALRSGALVPSGAAALWHVAPSGSDYAAQNGRVSFAASSANVWGSSNGVLAELTFQVQPGATNQYLWPVQLASIEVSSLGFNRPLAPGSAAFVGRDPRPGVFGHLARLTNGGFRFDVTGETNCNYVVEASSDLVHWTVVTTVTTAGGAVQVSDPDAAVLPARFYRVRAE